MGAADDIMGPLVSELERGGDRRVRYEEENFTSLLVPTLCKAKWFTK